jgi:hypothetical protein
LYKETSSQITLKTIPRNLKEIVRSWTRLQLEKLSGFAFYGGSRKMPHKYCVFFIKDFCFKFQYYQIVFQREVVVPRIVIFLGLSISSRSWSSCFMIQKMYLCIFLFESQEIWIQIMKSIHFSSETLKERRKNVSLP